MPRSRLHIESHPLGRLNWLRAAVLGANDGIISTSALMVGVASTGVSSLAVVSAGLAGLAAGALSMAAGEYVSVSSQADSEKADLARETQELKEAPDAEHAELAGIYVARGLEPGLAAEVARQLMRADALGAHARDELGITDLSRARPLTAAAASALAFTAGAVLPLLAALAAPEGQLVLSVALSSLAALALLGAAGAVTGRARPVRPVMRVVLWGAIALLVTAGGGALLNGGQPPA